MLTTVITDGTGVLVLAGAAWKFSRAVHDHLDAVNRNTSATAAVAAALDEHTTATNRRLDHLDQRLSTLEGAPR